jgi:phosphoribosylamine--glycine ligase
VKVLVVGSGGREHALAWKLAQSDRCEELHAAPGNPGIASLGRCHPIHAEDGEGLLAFCGNNDIDLAVIGPDAPVVAGVGDQLRHAGIAVFGPSADAARIEGSKTFAKDVMDAAGVPTAERLPVARVPCVVKADGLAAGKGVFVCTTQAELDEGLRAAAAFGDSLVIEELLEGEEVSLFAICDGRKTSSVSVTATSAPTPAGWAPTPPSRASVMPRPRSCSRPCTSRCSPSWPAAGVPSSVSSTAV